MKKSKSWSDGCNGLWIYANLHSVEGTTVRACISCVIYCCLFELIGCLMKRISSPKPRQTNDFFWSRAYVSWT